MKVLTHDKLKELTRTCAYCGRAVEDGCKYLFVLHVREIRYAHAICEATEREIREDEASCLDKTREILAEALRDCNKILADAEIAIRNWETSRDQTKEQRRAERDRKLAEAGK